MNSFTNSDILKNKSISIGYLKSKVRIVGIIHILIILLLISPNVAFGIGFVILSFDDSTLGQYTTAKPILDKYGFKGTFFTVCNYVGTNEHMNWTQIDALHKQGHDIESHTMNHKHLSKLSDTRLQYEIGQSKQCLADHGINSTVFAYPFADGSDKQNVVNVVAKYYNLARAGGDPIQSLKSVDRYSIHALTESGSSDSDKLKTFIDNVNRANLTAIAIIKFHTFTNETDNKDKLTTSAPLFEQEMKYLHDNGFKVLGMSDLGYDVNYNVLYVKKGATIPAPLQ
jgi:peptidoglycan/xylan/chitin deacetylase (PgdA/CDA1 family)